MRTMFRASLEMISRSFGEISVQAVHGELLVLCVIRSRINSVVYCAQIRRSISSVCLVITL